jgi:hypothetical protein
MLLGVDHLVIAVPDPDAAAGAFEKMLGLAATAGGRHESGTWNRLIFLGDMYLELVGIWDRARASAHPIGAAALAMLDGPGAGLATFALATDGIRRETSALHAAGSDISPPVAGSRMRPDGARVVWHTAVAAPLGRDRPPFLIEHEMDGPEWGAEARRARAAFVHPFGGTARLAGLELAVAHPAEVAAEFARAVGLAFRPAPGVEPGNQEARAGDHAIRLVPSGRGQSRTEKTADRPGERPGRTSVAAPERWPTSGDPVARVGIITTDDKGAAAGERVLVDLCGVRFARL